MTIINVYNPKPEFNVEAYGDYTVAQLEEWCGFIPWWIREFNILSTSSLIENGSLVDWLEERYGFGDLRYRHMESASISEDGTHSYPEDPDMPYIARIETKLGNAYVYPYGFVAIPQGKNNKHLVVRMD